MVDTDFLNVYDSTVYAQLPKLNPDDVTAAVLYALSTSEFVQVNTGNDDRCILYPSKHRRKASPVAHKDHLVREYAEANRKLFLLFWQVEEVILQAMFKTE